MEKVETLELNQDLEFQRREWLLERVGWFVFLGFISASLLGCFGGGGVSERLVKTADARIIVEYSGIARQDRSEVLAVTFNAPEHLAVIMSEALTRGWKIEEITPPPKSVVISERSTVYEFEGTGPGTVRIDYRPRKFGQTEGEIRFENGRSVRVKQMVLP